MSGEGCFKAAPFVPPCDPTTKQNCLIICQITESLMFSIYERPIGKIVASHLRPAPPIIIVQPLSWYLHSESYPKRIEKTKAMLQIRIRHIKHADQYVYRSR